MRYARHDEVSVDVPTEPGALFDYLDDQEKLAAHMNKPSMMMMGGRMFYEFDAARGRAVGSMIRMGGSFLWLTLLVEEMVTEHSRPRRKSWETQGAPRLIIIGRYRMGFEIDSSGASSRLRVSIDYDLPRSFLGAALGFLMAPLYARWCVGRMAGDARHTFVTAPAIRRPA